MKASTPCLICIFFIFIADKCLAIDQETPGERKAIASEKNRTFDRNNKVRQFMALSGYRDSDYNSKDYNLSGRYGYTSNRNVAYIKFEHESRYKIQVKVARGVPTKYSELYDVTLSDKIRILEQKNYVALYHRTQYDDMSDYYYDLRTAVGLGRFFKDQDIQFDLSLGYRDVKNYGNIMNVIPSLRVKFDLTDKLQFVQRGFFFIDHESIDNELITKLIYKIDSKISLQLTHDYEQTRYEDDTKRKMPINRVSRRTTIGIIYRF